MDAIPPEVLVSRCTTKLFDFERIGDEDLEDIVVPIDLPISAHLPPSPASPPLRRPHAPFLAGSYAGLKRCQFLEIEMLNRMTTHHA